MHDAPGGVEINTWGAFSKGERIPIGIIDTFSRRH